MNSISYSFATSHRSILLYFGIVYENKFVKLVNLLELFNMVTKQELAEALAEQSNTLKSELKSALDESISTIRQEIIEKLTVENVKLNSKISTLENKVVALEVKLESNLQYQRSSSVVINGIPMEIEHSLLEGIAIILFNSVCFHSISSKDIIACHRVSKKSSVVLVKFVNKKDAVALLEGKSSIANFDCNLAGLDNNIKLYVDEHLTPYVSGLAFKCRCLKRESKILQTKVRRGVVKVLLLTSNRLIWHDIYHTADIIKLIPDYVDS